VAKAGSMNPMPSPILRSRRELLALGVGVASFGCSAPLAVDAAARGGRLSARPPNELPPVPATTGAQPLGLESGRDGLYYVPPGLTGPAPLLLLLHGATGSANGIANRLGFALADELKLVLVAPDSRGRTWDAIRGTFGPDTAFIDRALVQVFARVPVDRRRLAVGGFSDGASYAISLGLVNGDLFTHVAAFSPGFYVADELHGRTRFWVSHGRKDEILPIDSTSRRLVPALEQAGYTVRYKEFDGPHTVPPALAREALEWITKS
jgi:phospholipase/carboxylesterase